MHSSSEIPRISTGLSPDQKEIPEDPSEKGRLYDGALVTTQERKRIAQNPNLRVLDVRNKLYHSAQNQAEYED